MRDTREHLDGLARLHRITDPAEQRAEFRQSFADLATAAAAFRPVPLEGLDPAQLRESARVALANGLLDDLGWLGATQGIGAIYELASALPQGDEKRELGRRVLAALSEGDAGTFVLLATQLAHSSRRGLTGAGTRARVALALDLPIGSGVSADPLALALIARRDLEEEWLAIPSTGALPSRRLAARLLERAAREAGRRVATGDESVLAIFERPSVRTAWERLLADREPLVWRHAAAARGLLSAVVPRLEVEIDEGLSPSLSPTEWRRAAASLAASIAVEPERAARRCHELLAGELVMRDPGLASAMVLGLPRAAEAEPAAAEELLTTLVDRGGIDAIEALVELREERLGHEFGTWAARLALRRLEQLRDVDPDDDGYAALVFALDAELRPRDEQEDRADTLRERIGSAREAFAVRNARAAYQKAYAVLEQVEATVAGLEECADDTPEGRFGAFVALRELDASLLETATLVDLLQLGARGDDAGRAVRATHTDAVRVALGRVGASFERMQTWLLDREERAVGPRDAVEHRVLRVRRLRALLHLVDADAGFGEERPAELRERRLRAMRLLLARSRDDAPSPLRRVVHAAAARACEAMLRDDAGELSDVLVAVVTHLRSEHDLSTFAEASMLPEVESVVRAYATLVERTERSARVTTARSRAGLDALRVLIRCLPTAAGPRVEALRLALIGYASALEGVALASSIGELAGELDSHGSRLAPLADAADALARIVDGARRRLGEARSGDAPACGPALRFVDLAALHTVRGDGGAYGEALESVVETLREELPVHVAEVAATVLATTAGLPISAEVRERTSFVPMTRKRDGRAALPQWLPPSRTLGGFFVLRSLGAGAGGSVFVARRAEEKNDEDAQQFALKVPEFDGTAARTLSEAEFLQLFREEAGALLAVPVHPNLARLVTFDAGARPKPILVMELVEGPSLERIKETGGLDMQRAIAVLDGVARGLVAMHDTGVGHLDLKPSNVILRDPDGPGPGIEAPVLVDFGLAGRKVRPGCATANYGAPEVWGLVPKGYTPTPMAVDVYAFACVAYEVLTGRELFDGPHEMAVVGQHLQHDGELPALAELASIDEHRAQLAAILRSALRQDPRKRISMPALGAALSDTLEPLRECRWPLA